MNKKQTKSITILIPQEYIESKILLIRGKKVMLDRDLAVLYKVDTKNLNKAVKRNPLKFPEDFMFQLNKTEFGSLRFQIGTSKTTRGGRRYLPYVFTEQGIAMVSSILNSKQAIQVNILRHKTWRIPACPAGRRQVVWRKIMRAFVKLREILISHKDLAQKIENLEHKFQKHDKNFVIVFEAIRKLLDSPKKSKDRIGFK